MVEKEEMNQMQSHSYNKQLGVEMVVELSRLGSVSLLGNVSLCWFWSV
jgi:hypothetical protein